MGHFRAYRVATGQFVKCPRCGNVMTYIRDAEDDEVEISPFNNAISPRNPFKDIGVGKHLKKGGLR